MPLVYTLNWIGNFNNVFKTRWSASVMNEAKDHNMYYYAVGNELNLEKWNAFVDFMYSKEAINVKDYHRHRRSPGRTQCVWYRLFIRSSQV